MILKELVSNTLGKSVTISEDSAHDIPADFYMLNFNKYMRDRKGKNFRVADVNIKFTTEDISKEVTWKYLDSFYKFDPKSYFYCAECNNYTITLICKDISDDGFVMGFREDEIMNLTEVFKCVK